MTTWTTNWPTERDSWWWLYARVWGDDEPSLYPVRVRKIANGFAYITSGHFLYSSEVTGEALWAPMTIPTLPKEGGVDV